MQDNNQKPEPKIALQNNNDQTPNREERYVSREFQPKGRPKFIYPTSLHQFITSRNPNTRLLSQFYATASTDAVSVV